MGKLTDAEIKKIIKSYAAGKRYSDGENLYLYVSKSRATLWHYKYSIARKENIASLGSYPEMTLAMARRSAQKTRELLSQGIDPNALKRERDRAKIFDHDNTFEAVAREWFGVRKGEWSSTYAEKELGRLVKHVFKYIGREPIRHVTIPHMRDVLKRIENAGTLETAHRVNITCGQIFNHAIVSGRADSNPCQHLAKTLKKPSPRHHAAITDAGELGEFLRAARGYVARNTVVAAALRLLPLLFLRPSELRLGTWDEVDFERAEWRIASARMKRTVKGKLNGEPHVVPLSRQALTLLRELKAVTGPTGLMFKGERSAERAISDNTVNAAIRALGYDTSSQVTGHGFRATARTLGVEVLGADERVLEHQLAHDVPDKLGRSYNRTEFISERREFMQRWADFLERIERPELELVRAVA